MRLGKAPPVSQFSWSATALLPGYSRNVKFDEREIGRPLFEEEVSAQHPLILDSVDEPKSYGEERDARNDTSVTEASPSRSTRERRQVDYYGFPQAHAAQKDLEPVSGFIRRTTKNVRFAYPV